MRRGGSVSGAVSLVMIFCVLCLAVFATLTYATADRERRLAELTALRAAEYYAADREATLALSEALRNGERGTWEFSTPVNDTQELHVSAELSENGDCRILNWSMGYAGSWDAEDTIELWDGGF